MQGKSVTKIRGNRHDEKVGAVKVQCGLHNGLEMRAPMYYYDTKNHKVMMKTARDVLDRNVVDVIGPEESGPD